jgi:hypothetical protein
VFVGCDVDKACHEAGHARLRKAFAEECLRGTFGPIGEELKEVVEIVVENGNSPRTSAQEWMQPPGLPVFCCLSAHLVSFLQASWEDMALDRDWKSIPVELWPEKMILRLDNMDPLLLRNVDCAHYGT